MAEAGFNWSVDCGSRVLSSPSKEIPSCAIHDSSFYRYGPRPIDSQRVDAFRSTCAPLRLHDDAIERERERERNLSLRVEYKIV